MKMALRGGLGSECQLGPRLEFQHLDLDPMGLNFLDPNP